MRLSSHAQRLERWLGKEELERISLSMKDWYGPPIAIASVPGTVYARGGGDFVGPLRGGYYSTLLDYRYDRLKKALRNARRRQRSQMGLGFTSLSDIIAEATAGQKSRNFFWNGKTGSAGTSGGSTCTLWAATGNPGAGGAAGAAPGGTVFDDASAGAIPFANPAGGDGQYLVSAFGVCGASNYTLMLYDRLFGVTKTMASTATEAVTGVPTRYQSTNIADDDYAGGNFLAIECRTALPATAHNWNTCLYTDQDGNASTLPSVTGNSSCPVTRLDMPLNRWFTPLEAGDTGIQTLTQMQCSASVASGAIDFVIGHPIAILPMLGTGVAPFDGINSAFNLVRILDDACLALLELVKPSASANTYNLWARTVAG